MKKITSTEPIIVIIATSKARTELLYERSLRSVYNQMSINPHQIYVVDDNPIPENQNKSDEYGKIKSVIKRLRKEVLLPEFIEFKKSAVNEKLNFDSFFHTTLLKNTRTRGFSGTGARNTAAFNALQFKGRNYFLAFLDDDDEWDKKYLKIHYDSVNQIEKIREQGKLRAVRNISSVSGILRIEQNKELKVKATARNFTKENFFIGNPGLQGSNLFIDLKTFWIIGGFDESLKSATDRDIAIRLTDYVNLRKSKQIQFINKTLVKHYANYEQRVTSDSTNKKNGLDTFYRKYMHQFPKEIQQKSLKRASKLFDYRLPEEHIADNTQLLVKLTEDHQKSVRPFNLIIGTISNNPQNLTELFKSFKALVSRYGTSLIDYKFFVLENTVDEYEIRPIINYFRSEKELNIETIEIDFPNQTISENRTLLQQTIYKKGNEYYKGDFVSWIIDDDYLFKYDNQHGETEKPDYFKIISEQKNKNIDAFFGLVSDAPPLPFLSTLRSQLLDFYYSLTLFANCNPEEQYNLTELQRKSIKNDEFYYDLSDQNFQHIEYPYYWEAARDNLSNLEAFEQFLNETALLSNGVNVFRKITYNQKEIGENIKKSIYRGGNTVILNPELLKIPNFTPDEGYNRRSDFNWAIINKNLFNRKLYEIVLPLKHDRHLQKLSLLVNREKLEADIRGLIFYRVLDYILSQDDWENKTDFSNDLRFYRQIKKQTFNKLKINNYRTLSLVYQILSILSDKKLWWFKNEYRKKVNYFVQQNIFTLETLRFELGKRKFQNFLSILENTLKIDDRFIKRIISKIQYLHFQIR